MRALDLWRLIRVCVIPNLPVASISSHLRAGLFKDKKSTVQCRVSAVIDALLPCGFAT